MGFLGLGEVNSFSPFLSKKIFVIIYKFLSYIIRRCMLDFLNNLMTYYVYLFQYSVKYTITPITCPYSAPNDCSSFCLLKIGK